MKIGRVALRVLIERDGIREGDVRIVFVEVFSEIREAAGLSFATASPGCCQVEEVVLSGEVPEVYKLTTLVDEDGVGSGVAYGIAIGLVGARVVVLPTAGVADLFVIEWVADTIDLCGVTEAVRVAVVRVWIESEVDLLTVVKAITVGVFGAVRTCVFSLGTAASGNEAAEANQEEGSRKKVGSIHSHSHHSSRRRRSGRKASFGGEHALDHEMIQRRPPSLSS